MNSRSYTPYESLGQARAEHSRPNQRLLLLFVDGLGLGDRDPEKNPLARFESQFLSFFKSESPQPLPLEGVMIPTRVDMGVPGLPQSATGQTALFTGRNAARELGHHMSGYPTPTLRKILDESSLFKRLRSLDKNGVFANALSREYFDRMGARISATTRALMAGGFPWLSIDDLRAGRAVSHDLTNQFLSQRGYQVPARAPEESARILSRISQDTDFTLFEFILTDMIGHSQQMNNAEEVVRRLDALLDTILTSIDLNTTTIVLTSDHGNFEDLSVKTHTKNLVPTCVWGPGREIMARQQFRIEEIAHELLRVLSRRQV